MSIRSLSNLAVERDIAPQGTPALGGAGGASGGAVPQQFADALTSAIPTETLAPYTAVIGVVAGLKAGNYLPFRWGAFVVFLALTAASVYIAYQSKAAPDSGRVATGNQRSFPAVEMAAALVAAAAWGLAMPGSALNTQLSGNNATIAAAAIAIGGAAVLSLMTPWLTKGAATPEPKPAPGPSGGPVA